jgi:nucleoside-diphosphate-sugar epimerase
MSGRTVAVSGGGGYVGSVLVPMLLGRGYQVRVLDLFMFEPAPAAAPGLDVFTGDVRDPDAVAAWVAGADAVVHLAGVANDPSCDLDPALSHSTNVDGSRIVVEAARRAGAGLLIYASSASVYGISDERPLDESAPLDPITTYGVTKCRAEEHLSATARAGLPAVALRFGAMFGYSPRLRLDLTVNLFTNHAVNRREVTVFGGRQVRPVLHVEDACRLILDVLDRRWPAGRLEVFNVACRNSTVADLATMVAHRAGERVGEPVGITYAAMPPDDLRSYALASDKSRRVLGFTPLRDVDDAVDQLCDAFARGLLADPLQDDRYFNVRRMKRLINQPSS